jgi:hypothetical protein
VADTQRWGFSEGVNELGVLVRRRGERGSAVRLSGVWGTRTIDRVGVVYPPVRYPEDFTDAPPLEPGIWQVIWSEVRRGKRREFLFHEETVEDNLRPKETGSEDGAQDNQSQ